MVPGTGLVLGGFGDPGEPASQTGGRYLDYTTGVSIYGTSMVGAKASVMGDVDAICNVAPIEIGNRVWLDSNSNGIQDGDELGIAGVRIELYQEDGTFLAYAITDSEGNYIFSSENKTSTISAIYGIAGLSQLSNYTIRVPDVIGGSKQSALGINEITLSNQSGTTNDETDRIDSDGILSGNHAEVSFTTGAFGKNSHVFDFGFRNAPCTVSVDSALPTACSNNLYNVDVTVSYTNPPSGDITINVGGIDYTFTPDGTSPDTYTVMGLTSNGTQDIDVSATFVGDENCTDVLVDAYDAPCACVVNCDDSNCTTIDSYDTATCTCVNTPTPPPSCDDSNCTTIDSYDTATCTCVNTPTPPPSCDDSNCTTTDSYDTATCTCVNTPIPPPSCDDSNCTTTDSYDTATCTCVNTPIPPPSCDDSNCTTTDSYDTATCTCVNTPIPPPSCDDSNCTTTDSYDTATCTCVNTPIPPPSCDDSNCTTTDSYDTATCTCVNTPIPPPSCDDSNCTTTDSYDTATCTCVNTPIPPPSCDDSNCTTTDSYDTATCTCVNTPTPPPSCDDSNCTTTDSYDTATCTCVNTPIPPPSW
ncbi:MAG: hypothetical protein IPL35_16550 [Sphingobacteriales bacterium]|nr:hypothetical protein [Sphingobacteriales bacterium]